MGMLEVALDREAMVVALDPGKVMNRVWVSNGCGLLMARIQASVALARSNNPSTKRRIVEEGSGRGR
ncbi:MAG: hypothetical protein EOP24_39980 [Hyphomicrobiales bacterium]|nr:MAG: hypothetical protein EOP24_39980 [Hyphomicrobiales bacterium]